MAHLWGAAGACQAACASARRFHRTTSVYPNAARLSAPDASGKGLARFSGNGYMSLIERSL
jgi:hypothetical protein